MAVDTITDALTSRAGSSERAWFDLIGDRNALAARLEAARRPRPVRPHRVGHSAPATRPVRRRFTGPPADVRGASTSALRAPGGTA
jgi:hypothetical protein